MTQLKEIFAKQIDRPINGVIKVGSEDEQVKQTELSEYVVTRELQNDFKKFFDEYDKSIGHPTEEMGVWISGFFGSGKSHFLKILSYLLENDVVAGKNAIDYFLEDGKFDDDSLKNSILKATSIPNDVILFNIDSKADSSIQDGNTILDVFLRVFNEKLGYSPVARVANMERELDQAGKFKEFQNVFKELNENTSWKDSRRAYILLSSRIQEALEKCGFINNKEAAKRYVDNVTSPAPFSINAEQFAKLIKDYLDQAGKDHHLIFLADEVGQFIGDDGNKMLNLQTIVEQLGIQCQGRAWVVVTSQQQMNTVVSTFNKTRDDFSKIQGRFKTMITMTSANAGEVIQKRLLSKKPNYQELLENLYQEQGFTIDNKINFTDSMNREKFDTPERFANNYPFIPYQFELLKDSLNMIRSKGANGKNMSDGERSMLATFQEAAIRYKESNINVLIPFAAFFPGMRQFLSHDHQVVFTKAENDNEVNPNNEDFGFNEQVLAVLFMVKYVETFKATLENITTLMLDNINVDLNALKNKVAASLKLLVRKNYVQQHVDTYEFLTDSEQEINEEINSIDIDDRSIVQEIGNYLLNSNLIDAKYQYPKKPKQYIFEFSETIDGSALNQTGRPLNIQIISPLVIDAYDPAQFSLTAAGNNTIVVTLKNDEQYIESMRRRLRLKEYLSKGSTQSDPAKQAVIMVKSAEYQEISESTNTRIEKDLQDADIYVLDNVLSGGSNFKTRLADAKKQLIDDLYRNLNYIDTFKSNDDLFDLLAGKNQAGILDNEENIQAINALLKYVDLQNNQIKDISLANVNKHFKDSPFGYADADIAWLAAKAFTDGKLRLFYNNEQLTLEEARKDPKNFSKYFVQSTYTSKIKLKPVKELSKRQKEDVKEYLDEVLQQRMLSNFDDPSEKIANEVKSKTQKFINKLQYMKQQSYANELAYPGHELLSDGIRLLTPILNQDSDTLFETISKNLDKFEDWTDEFEDNGLADFYGDNSTSFSPQQKTWNRSYDYYQRYKAAEAFLSDDTLKETTDKLIKNLRNDNASYSIGNLKTLNTQFADEYIKIIDKLQASVTAISQQKRTDLLNLITNSALSTSEINHLQKSIMQRFDEIDQKTKALSSSQDTNAYAQMYGLQKDIKETDQEFRNAFNDANEQLRIRLANSNSDTASADASSDTNSSNNASKTDAKPKTNEPAHVKARISHTYQVTQLLQDKTWNISSEADLDKYLAQLRRSIEHEMKNYDDLNINF